MSKIKHSISLFVSILRNIYERDWYTPYSQRPKKWRCGWGKRYAKGGVIHGNVDYEPEIGEEIVPLTDDIWESLGRFRQAHRRKMWVELEQALGRPLTEQDKEIVENMLEKMAKRFDEYITGVMVPKESEDE